MMRTHIIKEIDRSLVFGKTKERIQIYVEDAFQDAYINLTNKEALKLANTILEHCKDKIIMEIPKHHIEFVGKTQQFGGGLFSPKQDLEFEEYNVLNWRWGSAKVINMKTLKAIHPTIEYLVKKEGMKKSMWTKPFAVREILLEEENL